LKQARPAFGLLQDEKDLDSYLIWYLQQTTQIILNNKDSKI